MNVLKFKLNLKKNLRRLRQVVNVHDIFAHKWKDADRVAPELKFIKLI